MKTGLWNKNRTSINIKIDRQNGMSNERYENLRIGQTVLHEDKYKLTVKALTEDSITLKSSGGIADLDENTPKEFVINKGNFIDVVLTEKNNSQVRITYHGVEDEK